MSEAIAKQWLTDLVTTAQQRNHAAQINLFLKNVSVVGVPGFDNIGYQGCTNCTTDVFIQVIANDGGQHVRGIEYLPEVV